MTGDETPQNIYFRTACDPCSTAKVRCDKKRPACDRCIQIKLPCSYSESRKHGRQSWRKRLAHERMKSPGVNKDHQLDTVNPAIPPTTTGITLPDQAGWNSWMGSSSARPMGHQDMGSLLHHGQHVLASGDSSAILSSWSFGDGSGADIDIGSFANWELAGLSPSALPSGDSLHIPEPNQRDPGPGLGASVPDKAPSMAPTTSSTHDCEARAISILRSMQHGEMHHGATSCATDPTQYTDLNLTPSFDRVLAVNKSALEGWNKLMNCSCALCPHIILLHVSILSKMIFWYRIAATERSQLLGDAEAEATDSAPSNSSTESGSVTQDAPTVDQFSVRPTIIKVGMLSLDPEDQTNLRRIILLRELRRTEKAIDELMEVDRSAVEEEADEVVRRSVEWSLGGIARVREELQDVIQKVRQLR